ncbi:uncharacterized protein EDB91DRAFT_220555 [Suillus paluster]|uniref:uncharacterized protein n=1 Tax=Suillus paluster TaxID=48578 RepID=UPI001B87A875|nr:uncharacterized protein EDB91DRAFT_220555 [Suillus paluster]KAG1743661.1 hypothetical protein EDB91DRAFT_220555 [Suillus paluster]
MLLRAFHFSFLCRVFEPGAPILIVVLQCLARCPHFLVEKDLSCSVIMTTESETFDSKSVANHLPRTTHFLRPHGQQISSNADHHP